MQVYAASIMFGYFVRRVDKRFQLELSLGLLPQNQEEAVARLERLFSQVIPSQSALPPGQAGTVLPDFVQTLACLGHFKTCWGGTEKTTCYSAQ